MKICPTCGEHYEDTNTLCPSDGAVLKRDGDDQLLGQTLAGKYRIEEKIAEGGMGCVYRATHVLMEKPLAVKVLHPSLAADDNIVARFTREAKAASRISHPHALVVTDFGEDEEGTVFLVMEYLRGRTLKEVVRAEGPLPLARVAEIVRQVSGALDAAHAEGVVHRDLKSDNVMLEETAGGDWTKVLDFGIAKIKEPVGVTDPGLTAPNLIIGTPQYMSPEQCSQASEIDARSDIYSLGVIIYEMLAGHVPFTGDSPTAIMMKHLQEPPPSILDERKDLPTQVGEVVARALAKKPEDRFQKAGDLSDALALAVTQGAAASSAAGVAGAAAARKGADTNRIVVPTEPGGPGRTTAGAEPGEETGEETVVSGETAPPFADYDADGAAIPPPSSFNPWRLIVPSLAVLVIIFALFYAFQQRGDSGDAQVEPLSSDPNGQPVQNIAPPTGEAETNVAPQTNAGQPADGATQSTGDLPVQMNLNQNSENVIKVEEGRGSANQNRAQDHGEDHEEGHEEEATPAPTPANANRRAAPPQVNLNVNVEPPSPARKPTPRPTATQIDPPKGGENPPELTLPAP